MMARIQIAVALTILLAGSDLSALVKKLGSPRYADREEAAAELERIGRKAMPALKIGRNAQDPEIRSRASALYDHIETSLLSEPSLVEIDDLPRTVEEAVDDLSIRSDFPILIVGKNPEHDNAPISMRSSSPEPFWTALDRLANRWGLDVTIENPADGDQTRGANLGLVALQPVAHGTQPAPSSVSGPFRVTVGSMTRLLERRFSTDSEGVVRNPNLGPRTSGRTSDEFFLDLNIMAEPRMTLDLAGPVQVLQAMDELGHSMLASDEDAPPSPQEAFNRRFNSTRPGIAHASVSLRYPESPGRRIQILRGIIPLTVSSRKSDPLVIRLANSSGKTFRSDDSWITIHEVRFEPNLGQTTIDLSVRSPAASAGMIDQNPAIVGRLSGYADQIEILDERGSPITQWHTATQTNDFTGIRMSLKVMSGTKTPAEIRFHDLVIATTQAEFIFEDLPMP